jgi:hypothetical protein
MLVNNRFGIILEAGFPVAGTERHGDMDVTLDGNDIEQSCQAPLYVALARHTTGLGLNKNAWLANSTYRIRLWGAPAWADAWFANPEGFGNTLIVNGKTIDNGSHQFYEAGGCPGLATTPQEVSLSRIGIDATWKTGYPPPVTMPDEVVRLVERRWGEYFGGDLDRKPHGSR